MNNQSQRKNGYTLVETLVSIAIFSLLSVGIINIFTSILKTQTRILQDQEVMDQSNYSLEYMGKILRMAKKDLTGDCTGEANTSYGISSNQVTFLAYDTKAEEYRCRRFSFASDSINESKSSDETSDNLSTAEAITSSKVKITALTFAVTGDGVDTIQPKVTIMIEMEPTSQILSADVNIIVQTSISQRQLDIN